MTSNGSGSDVVEHFEDIIEESRSSGGAEEISVAEVATAFFEMMQKLAASSVQQSLARPLESAENPTGLTRISARFELDEKVVREKISQPTELDRFILELRSGVKISKVDSSEGHKFFICHSNVLSFEQVCHASCHGSRGRR